MFVCVANVGHGQPFGKAAVSFGNGFIDGAVLGGRFSCPLQVGHAVPTVALDAAVQAGQRIPQNVAAAFINNLVKAGIQGLDLGGISYDSKEILDKVINDNLSRWEAEFDEPPTSDVPGLRFRKVIEAAFRKTGQKVVILIDEYDKPIVDNIGKSELLESYKYTLQGFYSVMKVMDGHIRFGFLTGVSKIGKISVFSGLNNLKDISATNEYTDICGISEAELHNYFDKSVEQLGQANGLSKEECYLKLKDMYDGYHFTHNSVGVYNPFSLLNAFSDKEFREYWFATGTPTLLINVLKYTSFDVTTLSDNVVISATTMDGMNDFVNRPVPLFFQTGYLTIKEYDREYREYRLGFPNDEVKNGFLNFIYSYYVPVNPAEGNTTTGKLARALKAGEPERFMTILESLFANTTYQIQGDSEKNFQYAMYIIMELLGEHVQAERSTSNGRIDLLLQTKDYIYIVELKIDNTADAALQQIEDKGYAKPFANDSRKIFRIGVSFSTKDRRIEEWKVVE